MDSQAFEVLEKKINNVLSMLDRLKKEKEELLQKNQELQSLIKEKDDTIQTLKTEIERHNKAQIEVDTYRENQDHIRTKVESLLEKLKEFESL